MSKFYLFLWLRWSFRLVLCSVFLAMLASSFITAYLYISQGFPVLDSRILGALIDLSLFWFQISFSLTLLIALFRSIKYIFNKPIYGYQLNLISCDEKEILNDIGYGDLVKVWRKWFMLLIWLVGSEIVISFGFTSFFSSYDSIFEWFNIYILSIFILLAGYLSFILLSGRCKRVKVVKC
jgi:hypothetical protein